MKRTFIYAMATSALSLVLLPHVHAQQSVQAADLVEMFEKLGGSHPGHRKAHARGLCASATFSPNPNEAFPGAKLLANGELPVSMRFSVGGADPASDERTPGTRGVGIQIKLPDGSMHVFTGNNSPVFAGKDPETFYGFLATLLPDENGNRNPQKTGEYIAAHPSIQAHVAWQQSAETSASYANTEFFGLHTFYFNPLSGKQTKFRWHLTPDLGVKTLSKQQATEKDADFLTSTFKQQLSEQTVSFTLHASIGEAQDSDIDPSSQWPNTRPQVDLGTITVKNVGGDACNIINFDPNLLSPGFTPSADPVLQMRSAAYAISFGKRLSNQ
jgi:catalase